MQRRWPKTCRRFKEGGELYSPSLLPASGHKHSSRHDGMWPPLTCLAFLATLVIAFVVALTGIGMLQGALELVCGQPLPGTQMQRRYIDASVVIHFFMLECGYTHDL